MHTGDLGIVQYLLGNVLFELFLEMGGSIASWQETCNHLNMFIKQCARQVDLERPPVNALTLSMIRKGTKRKLRAKAAESLHMLKAVSKLLETYMRPSNDYQDFGITAPNASTSFTRNSRHGRLALATSGSNLSPAGTWSYTWSLRATILATRWTSKMPSGCDTDGIQSTIYSFTW